MMWLELCVLVLKPKSSTTNIHLNSLRHVGEGGLQCKYTTILAAYGWEDTTYNFYNQ
jgi:hypothetical protein